MLVDQALDQFLVQLEADGRSPHTIGQYRRHIRLLSRWLADVGHTGAIEAVSHETIAKFLASDTAQQRPDGAKKKAGSMNGLRSSLKVFFRYLHKAGSIDEDPTRLTRHALVGTAPPRGLTDDERTKLLTTLAGADGTPGRRDHVLFRLMLETGIRLGTAVALDVADVDLDRLELQVRTKGNREDRVFLTEELRDLLRTHIGERTSGALFTARGDERISVRHVQRRFAEWLKKAGIERPASPHSLRHTFARRMYRKSGDVLLVKEALLHRSITSTMVYARCDEERLRTAIG